MKKKLSVLLSFLPIVFLMACEEDFIYHDFAPIYVEISVQNERGENLLNPAVPGNLYDSEMYVVSEDKTFQVIKEGQPEPFEPSTREILPVWYGAFIENNIESDKKHTNPDENLIYRRISWRLEYDKKHGVIFSRGKI